MSLLSIHNISIAFGGPALIDDVSLEIHKGQRICFLGRNGSGKSTFMKILAGATVPDRGEVITESGVRIAYLPQDVPGDLHGTIYEVVAAGLGKNGALVAEFFRATVQKASATEIDRLHHLMHDADCWHLEAVINRVLSLTMLDGAIEFSTLSGGMRRRVFLARALVCEPDLLLLDEPTNHLDIASINWLETFLISSRLTVLFVTHDRRLLLKLATRIVEIDRGKLVDWSCDYPTFLTRKQAVLDAEEREWERFDKKLAQEEVWIRKGVQARRTRNEGRVRALYRLREERSQRRERSGLVQMEISGASRSGVKVIDARNVTFAYDNKSVIRSFTGCISRSDRIGIIGANGSGKTTLLKLLLGKLQPQQGSVDIGTNVQPLFFDQLREVLDPEKTVWENVAPGGGDTVFVSGAPKHVMSYLQDFLFTADRAKSPVKQLSGGERHRLLLARLFSQPSNLLVLDEPTNDLDTETLELLEELVDDYAGTVLIVSHDRAFLNNVVTSILAFEDDGVLKEYVGGYDDWERQSSAQQLQKEQQAEKPALKEQPIKNQAAQKRTYREQQEFAALPGQIEKWEAELAELTSQMSNAENFRKEGFARDAAVKISSLENSIAAGYIRWEELEGKCG